MAKEKEKEKSGMIDKIKGAVKNFQDYQAEGRKRYHRTEEEIRNSPENKKFIQDQQSASKENQAEDIVKDAEKLGLKAEIEGANRHKEYR